MWKVAIYSLGGDKRIKFKLYEKESTMKRYLPNLIEDLRLMQSRYSDVYFLDIYENTHFIKRYY